MNPVKLANLIIDFRPNLVECSPEPTLQEILLRYYTNSGMPFAKANTIVNQYIQALITESEK